VFDPNATETLAFSRVPGSGPDWLSVNAIGHLAGTPGLADLGTNQMNVQVMDSTGFTARTQVQVFVRDSREPELSAIRSGSDLQLRLDGNPGQRYQVLYQPHLETSGSWLVLTDLLALAVSPFVLTDPATNAHRFYRVVSVP
jgi:hypothetical protein